MARKWRLIDILKSISGMKALLILLILSTCLWLLYKNPEDTAEAEDTGSDFSYYAGYILYNSKCRIPNIAPFNPEVLGLYQSGGFMRCSALNPLTYVTKNNDSTEATLHIDERLVSSYSKTGLLCCMSNVTRSEKSGRVDKDISVSMCEDFNKSIALSEIPVLVKCWNGEGTVVYNNSHAPVIVTKKVQEKISKFNSSRRVPNVLLVGLDSISRLNSMRLMPLTRGFLEGNDWLEMGGYNKIADSTLPNLIAVLSGRNSTPIVDKCDPTISVMDECNLLWYDFERQGFITAYGEDHIKMGTFNYADKKGFLKEPTDYYFRPYFFASEKLKTSYFDDILYCVGPISCTERLLNITEDYAVTLKDVPNFGFFWINHGHNTLNAIRSIDILTKKFLENLQRKGVLENSIVLFFSDHGLRFGRILQTYTGWFEARLPMMFIWIPEWFREANPLKFNNMRLNTNKLTTPYDVHMTLQDILESSGVNHTITQSEGCPTCKSLFSNIPKERSCEEASIDLHWCACNGYTHIKYNDADVKNATQFSLRSIQEIVSKSKEAEKCVKYGLKKLISSRISKPKPHWYNNDTHLLLIFETEPSATFEVTVKVNPDSPQRFSLEGGISRLDMYKPHAGCVDSSYLKMYCYCKY